MASVKIVDLPLQSYNRKLGHKIGRFTIKSEALAALLYYRKISAFIPFEDEILVKKTPTSLQWTLILIFCVDVHMGRDPLPPSTCIHLSLTPYPSVWTS